MAEESEQAFESVIGVFVNVLGHLVVHEGIIFVPYNSTRVGDLGNVSVSCAVVGAASVPDLVVENGDAACFAQVRTNLILVGFPFGCLIHVSYVGAKKM